MLRYWSAWNFLWWAHHELNHKKFENPLKISLVFLIRHSLYGLAMFEGFRWFT